LEEVVREKFPQPSPLKSDQLWAEGEPRKEWTPDSKRCGLIAKKIGVYPLWTRDGKRILTTLLQVIDNHVIRYYSPEEYQQMAIHQMRWRAQGFGCLIMGAQSVDPQRFTAAYCGLFKEAGVQPKAKLTRMLVTDDARLQPGTPLNAMHFRPGDIVDVYGKTVDHGFQGVMKRWGFKGGPGRKQTTKAYRRVGSIGEGRKQAIKRGKKMPGHMGAERRTLNAQTIVKINTKYNVIYVRGPAVPGSVGNWVYIYDTKCHAKQHKPENPPSFPTYFPQDAPPEPVPEELVVPELHRFEDPTLVFVETEEEKKVARAGAKLAKVRAKK
jgi:large subunit ribosomal protein L3